MIEMLYQVLLQLFDEDRYFEAELLLLNKFELNEQYHNQN
jgi:hypothetical protein